MIEQNDYKYIQLGKASVLVDGQFGSTGKGLFAAYLAEQPQNEVDWAVTNASANAGHTTKYQDGYSFVCYHLPTFGIIQRGAKMYLNAGAIIYPDLLLDEIDHFNIKDRLFIHPMAAVITKEDITREEDKKSMTSIIASTQKGVGQALSNKITRSGRLAKNEPSLKKYIRRINLNEELLQGARVSVEVPQGFSLSINGPFYPHCTSRNCTVMAGLNDADIHPNYLGTVAMTLRTYPIRVGHIMDKSGASIIGHSGPVYEDQEELSWDDIGVDPEYTTVTGRQRRIFTWSYVQFHAAISANRPDILFLNFMNYLSPEKQSEMTITVKTEYIASMGESCSPKVFYGFGPNVEDVKSSLIRG